MSEKEVQAMVIQALVMTDFQAAEFLGQSVFTLRKHRSLGIGPKYCKLGRSVRYRLADLEEYVSSSVVCR
jgi:predicted DNA-binding transcriptional regulator AlpA